VKTLLQPRAQSLAFLGGLALLSFGGGPASPSPHVALQPAENVPVSSLPFEYFREHIWVTMQINNSGPHVCVVDNGSNADVITEPAARAIGLHSAAVGGKTPNAKGLGEATGPEMFVAENSVVFGVQGSSILTGQALVLNMAPVEKALGRGFDCVIGSPLFVRFVVEINFAKHQLTLYEPGSFVYRGQGHGVPLRIDVPPSVRAEVLTPDGRTIKAILGLDLGSDLAFDFWSSFQSKHHILQARQTTVTALATGAAGEFHESLARLPSVDFAGFRIEKPLAAFLDIAPGAGLSQSDGYIGNAVLDRFTVIFDYSRRQVILEPNDTFGDPFTANMTGIGADATSDPARGFDVKSLDDGSVAATAGLKPGDRIVEINGVLCSTLTFESFHQMLTAEGAPFTLKIERDGQKIDISFQSPRLP
jgi:hypothetical protein